jgi:hypothetical protein
MNRWWTRSERRIADRASGLRMALRVCWVFSRRADWLMLSPLLAAGCSIHQAPPFETASRPPDEPRRPDGVAVDLEGSLPPAQATGSTESGLVPLKEPLDVSQAMQAVRTFFHAVSDEDLEAMRTVLASDAQLLPLGTGNGMRVDRHWERRFRKLDYTALGGEPLYRESMVETYRYEDLDTPLAGRPLRPAAMVPDDVLIRVPVTRTRFGIDRVFGDEILFVLRREARQFEIQTVYEDFTAP